MEYIATYINLLKQWHRYLIQDGFLPIEQPPRLAQVPETTEALTDINSSLYDEIKKQMAVNPSMWLKTFVMLDFLYFFEVVKGDEDVKNQLSPILSAGHTLLQNISDLAYCMGVDENEITIRTGKTPQGAGGG